MTFVRTIQIRLSRDQFKRIKDDSALFGFDSMSSYIRYLALGRSQITERKIDEIHQVLFGDENKPVKIKKYAPFIENAGWKHEKQHIRQN